MKIARVEPIHLRLPTVSECCDGSQETLAVKVHTDAGITGVGEVDSSALVAKAVIEAPLSHQICRGLAECIVGQDQFEIDRLVHVEQNARRHTLTKQRFPVVDGDIRVPKEPGLGIDLDENVVETYRVV